VLPILTCSNFETFSKETCCRNETGNVDPELALRAEFRDGDDEATHVTPVIDPVGDDED
jgi:hypothetical protein